MENTQPLVTGTPGNIKPIPIIKVYKGENWGFPIELRDYQGNPLSNPSDYLVYAAFANRAGEEDPFLVFGPGGQDQPAAPASDTVSFNFTEADMVPVAEGQNVVVDIWAEPISGGGSVLQARLQLTLQQSVKRVGANSEPPDGDWLMATGSWADDGTWDDTQLWTEAA